MGKIKPLNIIIFLLLIVLFVGYNVKKYNAMAEEVAKYNALVEETNECLEVGDWNCAEKNVRILLKETPNDTNLHLHLAGILYEQERYRECIRFVDSLNYTDKDFAFLKEKSESLIHEMAELNLESSGHFRLEFEGQPSRNDILEALSVLEIAYDSLCRLFDFRPENKMRLVLYQSTDYQGIGSRPDWVGAVFDGKLRVPVNVMQYREVYRPLLFHELTHAFVRAMTRAKVPLWLNEGLAQVIDASRNDEPKPVGAKPDLKMLTEPFVNQENREVATKLYWYSQRMVEALLYRNGAASGSLASLQQIRKLRMCIQEFRNLGVDESLKKYFGLTSAVLLERVN